MCGTQDACLAFVFLRKSLSAKAYIIVNHGTFPSVRMVASPVSSLPEFVPLPVWSCANQSSIGIPLSYYTVEMVGSHIDRIDRLVWKCLRIYQLVITKNPDNTLIDMQIYEFIQQHANFI